MRNRNEMNAPKVRDIKRTKYSDAAEAVKRIFRIYMKAEEEIGAVIEEFKNQHEAVTPERLCYFASLDPSFSDTAPCLSDVHPEFAFPVPLVLRMVFHHFYPSEDHDGVFKNFKYYRDKGIE